MNGDAWKRTSVSETTASATQSFFLRNVFCFPVCFLLLLQFVYFCFYRCRPDADPIQSMISTG